MIWQNSPARCTLLILALGGQACWVPTETGKIMQDDIAQLKSSGNATRHDLDALKALEYEQMQAVLKKIEEMSNALQDFNHSARLTDADFGAQMEHIIHDVQDLRGAVEVNEHRLGETETKLEETIAKRLEAMKKVGGEGGETAAAAENAIPKDKKDALNYAAKLVHDNKTNDARAVYRNISKQWPKDTGITDEAFFRLGESYFKDNNFEAALREYIKVVDKFGSGSLADDAYFQIGLCSMELGRLEDAQTFFSEIVTNHKKSPLVKSAKAHLEEVNRRLDSKNKARKKR